MLEIIDNALSDNVFKEIQEYIMGTDFPWYYRDSVAYPSNVESSNKAVKKIVSKGLTDTQKQYNSFMVHIVYDKNRIYSDLAFEKLQPLIDVINPKALLRIKINSYPKTPTVIHHQDHVDRDYKHKGALFYINTNNGMTVVENKTEIKSVENKLLVFDSSKLHHSTTTSDSNRRVTLNINYF